LYSLNSILGQSNIYLILLYRQTNMFKLPLYHSRGRTHRQNGTRRNCSVQCLTSALHQILSTFNAVANISNYLLSIKRLAPRLLNRRWLYINQLCTYMSWCIFAARRNVQRDLCYRVVSIRMFVCLIRSCVVSKRVNLFSNIFFTIWQPSQSSFS